MTYSSTKSNKTTQAEEKKCYTCGHGTLGNRILLIECKIDVISFDDKPILKTPYDECEEWIPITCQSCAYEETCSHKRTSSNSGCTRHAPKISYLSSTPQKQNPHAPPATSSNSMSQLIILESMGFCRLPIETLKKVIEITAKKFSSNEKLKHIVFIRRADNPFPPPPPEMFADEGQTLLIHNLSDETIHASKEIHNGHEPLTDDIQHVLSFMLASEG